MLFSFPASQIIEKEQRKILIRRIFTRIFIDDWLMKLVALVITMTLWLGVTGLESPTTTRLRGVTLNLLIANDLEVTNSPVEEVDLVIRGAKQRVDQILPRDITVSIDLTDIEQGDRTVQITPQNINVDLPAGVEVLEVQPNKIAIKLERVEELEVPIRIETDGLPEVGYEVYGTRAAPDTVRVRGPESFVKALSFVTTEKVSVAGAKSDFTVQQLPLNLVNPKITLVSAATTNVIVRVGRKRIERLFVVPFESDSGGGRASVLLFGPSDILEDLRPADIKIVEDETGTGSGQSRVVLAPEIRGLIEVRETRFSR